MSEQARRRWSRSDRRRAGVRYVEAVRRSRARADAAGALGLAPNRAKVVAMDAKREAGAA